MNNSSRPCAPVWRNSTQKTTLFSITVLLVLERPVAGAKGLLLLVMLVKTCCCAPVRKTCWDKQQALKKHTRCYVAGVKMQASCTAGAANVSVFITSTHVGGTPPSGLFRFLFWVKSEAACGYLPLSPGGLFFLCRIFIRPLLMK